MGARVLAAAVVALCWAAQAAAAFRNVTTRGFEDGYMPLFGERNVLPSGDGRSVRLLLDQYTGEGLCSSTSSSGLLSWAPFCVLEWATHASRDSAAGSGFISSDLYNHGFFSAKIKLPSDYTAGVVVAFYVSISINVVVVVNYTTADSHLLRALPWKQIPVAKASSRAIIWIIPCRISIG